ncbi:MAG: hypothetical protein ACKO2N_24145 [Tabrizicola sp.]
MSTLSRIANRLSRPVPLIVLFLLMVGFSTLMNAPGLPTSGAEFERLSGGPAFDFATGGYTDQDFLAQMTRAGAEGTRVYRNFMLLDLVFPAIYALFWLGLLSRATRTASPTAQRVLILPVVTAAIDYLENLLVALNLAALPTPSAGMVTLASASTQAKFIATGLLLAAAVVTLLLWAWRAVRKRA